MCKKTYFCEFGNWPKLQETKTPFTLNHTYNMHVLYRSEMINSDFDQYMNAKNDHTENVSQTR